MRPSAVRLSWAALVLAGCGSPGAPPVPLGAQGAEACARVATEYALAFPGAAVCDPAAADSCAAERPLAVMDGYVVGQGLVSGLCWMAHEGFVNPARAAALDDILARYSAAGCALGSCPGPSPHQTTCRANSAGIATCGGV